MLAKEFIWLDSIFKDLVGLSNKHFRDLNTTLKEDQSELTQLDLAIEDYLMNRFAKEFPGLAVYGEEHGGFVDKVPAQDCIIIDPVDGTTALSMESPMFGTLIAFVEAGEPIMGIILFPLLNEYLVAKKGAGCWRIVGNEKNKVNVLASQSIDTAFISSSGVHASNIVSYPNEPTYNLIGLIRKAKKFRLFGDCFQHALVCRGKISAAIDGVMAPWDLAALIPCVNESGGVISSVEGQPLNVFKSSSVLSVCSVALHDEMVELLNTQSEGE